MTVKHQAVSSVSKASKLTLRLTLFSFLSVVVSCCLWSHRWSWMATATTWTFFCSVGFLRRLSGCYDVKPFPKRSNVITCAAAVYTATPVGHACLLFQIWCAFWTFLSLTWLLVSTHARLDPVDVFQKRIQPSAVPPPEASSRCWCGDHARAFTAAVCSRRMRGSLEQLSHTSSCSHKRPGSCNQHEW